MSECKSSQWDLLDIYLGSKLYSLSSKYSWRPINSNHPTFSNRESKHLSIELVHILWYWPEV
jgi:hypothetical protein